MRAAQVATVSILDQRPAIARMAACTEDLLRDPPDWEDEPPRVSTLLAPPYRELILRGIAGGMFVLLEADQLKTARGKAGVSGAFCVPKDDVEGRAISPLEIANSFVGPMKLVGVEYPCMPMLSTMEVPPSTRVLRGRRGAWY